MDWNKVVFLLKKPSNNRTQIEIELLVSLTSGLPFFRKLYNEMNGQHIHEECCKHMTIEQYRSDTTVFHIDSIGDKFYIILDGKVSVWIRKQESSDLEMVKILEQGQYFGELALINKAPRMATISCVSDCYFAVLHKKQFKSILLVEHKKILSQNIEFFGSIPIFNQLHERDIKQLYLNSFAFQYHQNQVVVHQNDVADCIYLVKEGEYLLKKKVTHNNYYQQDSRNINILIQGEKQILGLNELTTGQPYQYSIVCQSKVGYLFKINAGGLLKRVLQYSKQDLQTSQNLITHIINNRIATASKVQTTYQQCLNYRFKTVGQEEDDSFYNDEPQQRSIARSQYLTTINKPYNPRQNQIRKTMEKLALLKDRKDKIKVMKSDLLLSMLLKNNKNIRFPTDDIYSRNKKNYLEHSNKRFFKMSPQTSEGLKRYRSASIRQNMITPKNQNNSILKQSINNYKSPPLIRMESTSFALSLSPRSLHLKQQQKKTLMTRLTPS